MGDKKGVHKTGDSSTGEKSLYSGDSLQLVEDLSTGFTDLEFHREVGIKNHTKAFHRDDGVTRTLLIGKGALRSGWIVLDEDEIASAFTSLNLNPFALAHRCTPTEPSMPLPVQFPRMSHGSSCRAEHQQRRNDSTRCARAIL